MPLILKSEGSMICRQLSLDGISWGILRVEKNELNDQRHDYFVKEVYYFTNS